MKKNVVILGSTGSIGKQSLEVISRFPEDFRIVGLAANRSIDLLEEQIGFFDVPYVAVMDDQAAEILQYRLSGTKCKCLKGSEGILELVRLPEAELILVAVAGVVGLKPTFEAIKHKKNIALANKETLVAGGNLIMDAVRRNGVQILPVDSEHSAIFQCLDKIEDVAELIITGSGGPFRKFTREQLKHVRPEMALKHPTWKMGPKITIDSATLMNKGLEVIEAKWLFGVDYDQIDVVIHPQSIIHSLVRYKDGMMLAQLGWPDMRLPIQYALLYPVRKGNNLEPLDLVKAGQLTFEPPDLKNFPSLSLAREAGKAGGTMPVVLNAANEIAVNAFLNGRIKFLDIPDIISDVMSRHDRKQVTELDDILAADRWARQYAEQIINTRS